MKSRRRSKRDREEEEDEEERVPELGFSSIEGEKKRPRKRRGYGRGGWKWGNVGLGGILKSYDTLRSLFWKLIRWFFFIFFFRLCFLVAVQSRAFWWSGLSVLWVAHLGALLTENFLFICPHKFILIWSPPIFILIRFIGRWNKFGRNKWVQRNDPSRSQHFQVQPLRLFCDLFKRACQSNALYHIYGSKFSLAVVNSIIKKMNIEYLKE